MTPNQKRLKVSHGFPLLVCSLPGARILYLSTAQSLRILTGVGGLVRDTRIHRRSGLAHNELTSSRTEHASIFTTHLANVFQMV